MIIDINAYLGHYPFRRLTACHADAMVELMKRQGIDRAIVSSLHALFYRDVHRGNQDLYEETHKWDQRFVCVATTNPKYAGWQHDLDQAIEQWGMKAVTLAPAYHGYSLTDEHGQAALAKIMEFDLPLVLTQRFEDRRQRHHWDVAEDLELSDILEIARAHPRLRIVFNNWIGLDGTRLSDAGLKGRCLLDFARLHVLLNKDVPKLITNLGIDAIAFGSHMPFDYVGPSLVKLSNLESLPAEDFEKVSWRNAATFFKLE